MKPNFIACISLAFFGSFPLASAENPVEIDIQEIQKALPNIQIEICEEHPGPQTEAIPKMYAEEKAIALKLEALIRNKGYYQVKFRIINPTDKPMKFTGYSVTSPLTRTQHWVDGKWVDPKPLGLCGTGLNDRTIAPGQSAVFQTSVQGEKLPARIGLAYQHGTKKGQLDLWSEKIER